LKILSLLGLLATGLALWEINPAKPRQSTLKKNRLSFLVLSFIGIILFYTPSQPFKISAYKGLSQILNINGSEIILEKSSPLGFLSIVSNQQIPFRHAPGLSLNNTQEPLAQVALFTDADNMSAINQFPADSKQLAYLDRQSSALPYHLNTINNLLIVGAGGGSDILQAYFHQAREIDVIEHNKQIIDLLEKDFSQYSGDLSQKANIMEGEIRGFLDQNNKKYDLLQVSLMDSFNASSSGLYALHEGYLYTIEALTSYLKHLNSDGYLTISRWVKTPPRDSLKIFATAIKALQQLGIKNADKHLILIRSWQTSTLLVKKSPLTTKEIQRLKTFCQINSFDMAWYPGIKANEVNRFNQFRTAYFYQAAQALLSESNQNFLKQYKYYLYPASDNKPFFHHFFKWPLLSEIFKMHQQGAVALIEMSYISLLATLIIALLISIFFIFIGLIFSPLEHYNKLQRWDKKQSFIYFFCLGLAFLFIEIAMMQKFILFLHHPIYAIPVILSAFLIFAGLGSILSKHWLKQMSYRRLLIIAISVIISFCLIYVVFLEELFDLFISFSLLAKLIITLFLIAPLAVVMGIPFPLGLSYLSQQSPNDLSWAWSINGYASVISAVLATLLAIHFGFNWVIIFSIGLYLLSLRNFLSNYQSNS